ncbi:MAG: LVIVD repeat-containing protein [Actinomycetota bacterium]
MKRFLAPAGLMGLAMALASPLMAGPSIGGVTSKNLEYVAHVAISIDGVGGRVVDDYFYTSDQNKIMIFDISTPRDPSLVGVFPMPQELMLGREDLDTNGKILIVPHRAGDELFIIDVEEKSNPRLIASLLGAGQHTSSCVLDCRWAYGSGGAIVDLRDPTHPKLVEEKWSDVTPAGPGHDVTEVAPGLVLTAQQPIAFLDARRDPKHPKLLGLGPNRDVRFIHATAWANHGRDHMFLAGGETVRTRCEAASGAFMTWDASDWRRTHTFRMIDQHRMTGWGAYLDGNPPVTVNGCSSHWFSLHPGFRNGGLVAGAAFEHGTRLLRIDSRGRIKEVGWFVPWGGNTSAAYWIDGRTIYAVDYNRGIDILEYTGGL